MSNDTPAAPQRPEISKELSSSYVQLNEALLHDRALLQREVLIWQRLVRYLMVVVAVGTIALVGQRLDQRGWNILGGAAAAYFVFNALTALAARFLAREKVGESLQAAILGVDVAMITILVYVSGPPAQYHRILLLGFLVLLLTGFYFGRRLGTWALVLLLTAYVGASYLLIPHVDGPRPLMPVAAFNAALFFFSGGVTVLTLGSFRERMDRFRLMCKRFELGDLSGEFESERDRLPDDLTLVGRSFNEMRGRLIELIGTDALTGVVNRRAFETRLRREWRQAKRRDSTLALLMIDIDHFKLVNDSHGHLAGDVALQELAEIMRVTARETDVVARFGGDEFVILLPDTGWQGAMTFAERLRMNVDDHSFMVEGARLEITISIGVALARGTDPISVDDLLEQVDRSLYKAKSGGRNRISA